MSDWIEVDGRKYYEASYLELANNNTRRAQERAERAEKDLEDIEVLLNKTIRGYQDIVNTIRAERDELKEALRLEKLESGSHLATLELSNKLARKYRDERDALAAQLEELRRR